MKIDIQRTQGYINPFTGEFTGVFGLLQRKEADVSGSLFRYLIKYDEKLLHKFISLTFQQA